MIGTLAADKYVILGMISEGGMGAVYRALQLPVEREVALKVLRTELQDSDQGRDRFILEARAVSRLNHPNIITLHDFGFDSSQHPYMVMEYAPGKSMARWLRDDVDIDRIVHVMKQVLSALSEAHDRGIVHRDLKPENMIVTKAGSDYDYIKLLDFGIARLINEGSTRKLTREGEVFGTPHYMAPEQARNQEVDARADVYSMGVILFELITGQRPFQAPTAVALMLKHVQEPLPVERLGPIPTALRDALERACSKQVDERWESAAAFSEALERIEAPAAALTTPAELGAITTDDVASGPRTPQPVPTLEGPSPTADSATESEEEAETEPAPPSAHELADVTSGELFVVGEERGAKFAMVVAVGALALAVVAVAIFVGQLLRESNGSVESPVDEGVVIELLDAGERSFRQLDTDRADASAGQLAVVGALQRVAAARSRSEGRARSEGRSNSGVGRPPTPDTPRKDKDVDEFELMKDPGDDKGTILSPFGDQ
jgi:serine/threonine-protein kinase